MNKKMVEKEIPYLTEATVLTVKALHEEDGRDVQQAPDRYHSIVTVQTAEGTVEYEADAVIAATGCRERGRGLAGNSGITTCGNLYCGDRTGTDQPP